MKNQIHTFLIQGEITPQDLTVLNGRVLKYLESDPAYVIIDLSQAQLSVSELELQKILREIKTFAQAKDLSLVISQSDVESMHAQQMVVEMALQKKLQFLENKIELRQQIQLDAVRLREENDALKKTIEAQPTSSFQHKLSPIAEKLWSEK